MSPDPSISTGSTTAAAAIHIWAASARSHSKPRWHNEIGDGHKTVTSPRRPAQNWGAPASLTAASLRAPWLGDADFHRSTRSERVGFTPEPRPRAFGVSRKTQPFVAVVPCDGLTGHYVRLPKFYRYLVQILLEKWGDISNRGGEGQQATKPTNAEFESENYQNWLASQCGRRSVIEYSTVRYIRQSSCIWPIRLIYNAIC